ncbi:MAG TPA: nitrilase-related carbon-nitrogen hydrolase, partial [Woeseiaceae bacterium]|nr:nitrilase-related carbon-nitrogen hydrolase [Woeseiaceae bacterium]
MAASFTVACVQHCARDDLRRNLATLTALVQRAVAAGADLVALPEACDYLTGAEGGMRAYAAPASNHEALAAISGLAAAHAIWILAGSLTM